MPLSQETRSVMPSLQMILLYAYNRNIWLEMYKILSIHRVPQKEVTKLLPITFSNLNRFSKFFHCWIEDEYFQQNCVIFSTKVIGKSLVASFFGTRCIYIHIQRCVKNMYSSSSRPIASFAKLLKQHAQTSFDLELCS